MPPASVSSVRSAEAISAWLVGRGWAERLRLGHVGRTLRTCVGPELARNTPAARRPRPVNAHVNHIRFNSVNQSRAARRDPLYVGVRAQVILRADRAHDSRRVGTGSAAAASAGDRRPLRPHVRPASLPLRAGALSPSARSDALRRRADGRSTRYAVHATRHRRQSARSAEPRDRRSLQTTRRRTPLDDTAARTNPEIRRRPASGAGRSGSDSTNRGLPKATGSPDAKRKPLPRPTPRRRPDPMRQTARATGAVTEQRGRARCRNMQSRRGVSDRHRGPGDDRSEFAGRAAGAPPTAAGRRSVRSARHPRRRFHSATGDRGHRRLRHQSGARADRDAVFVCGGLAGTAGRFELVAP